MAGGRELRGSGPGVFQGGTSRVERAFQDGTGEGRQGKRGAGGAGRDAGLREASWHEGCRGMGVGPRHGAGTRAMREPDFPHEGSDHGDEGTESGGKGNGSE